jgi:hypothetical protein
MTLVHEDGVMACQSISTIHYRLYNRQNTRYSTSVSRHILSQVPAVHVDGGCASRFGGGMLGYSICHRSQEREMASGQPCPFCQRARLAGPKVKFRPKEHFEERVKEKQFGFHCLHREPGDQDFQHVHMQDKQMRECVRRGIFEFTSHE